MSYRKSALDMLISRRPFDRGGLEWQWRTKAAWGFLQMAMKKPACKWTDTPPKTTIGN